MLDKSQPITDMSDENNEDWKVNTVEPVLSEDQKTQKEQEEDKREHKQKMGSGYTDDTIEFS